jgi:hypothetical protein
MHTPAGPGMSGLPQGCCTAGCHAQSKPHANTLQSFQMLRSYSSLARTCSRVAFGVLLERCWSEQPSCWLVAFDRPWARMPS